LSERHDAQIALMKFLSTVARRAGADEHVYVVGGAVRDFVMGRPIKDVDVVVDAVSLRRNRDSAWFAEQVVRSIPVASSYVTNQYGVAIITVKGPWVLDGQDLQGEVIEIANARKESYGAGDDAGKGYKPTDVQLATIHEDVERREFTFNTLLWRLRDLATGPEKAEVIDLTRCGLRDLEQGTVRCPRDPDIVFSDDPTRMIRLIKFVGRYGFKVPPDVAASVRRNAGRIAQAPWEAIASLLVHDIIEKPYARRVLPMMKDLGLLDAIAGMVASTPPFRSYLERELRGKPAHLVADLLEHGLTDPTPVKALTPDQRARFVDVVRGLSALDAELLSSALQRPPVDNNALIAEFALRAEQRGRIAPLAREALLDDPTLASDPAALTDAVRVLLGTGRTAGELIPGGKARDLSPSAFDPDELARGVEVEREHTPDPAVAREIAMDHLTEFPDYYTRLDRMESEARAKTAAAPKKYDHIDFKPPKGVASAAAKGLELRQKASPSNRGGFTPAQAAEEGIGSGVQRAVNLKNRDTVSPDVIKQMVGFFARHEKNKDVPADKKGEPWNAKGYVAWLLWGGDSGRSWAEKVRGQMDAADEKEKPSKKASLDEVWGDTLPRVASRPVQARTYNRIVMYDFDGTLFRSWEKTPTWWTDPTPYSFFSKPESLDVPCVPENPGSNYWISKAVKAAQEDTHDRNTYSVLITGRVRVHAERVAELLAQKGITFNKMIFNPGMSAAKFKTIALGQLLAGHNTVSEVAIWENENQSHYAQYLSVASAALGRSDINVVVHNIHEKAIPLTCGPEDFGVEARTASMFHGRDVTTPEQVKAEFDHNLALFRRDFDDAMRTMTRYGDTPEVWAAGRAAVPATAAFLAFLAGRTLTSLAAQIKLVPSQHRRLFETARREFARTRKFDYPTWFGKNIAMLRMMYDVGSWPDVPAETSDANSSAGAVTLLGSIRIVNQTDQDPDKSVDIVRRAVRALSDSGVPSITRALYGDVFIVGEVARKKSLAAWYYKDRDIIEVLAVKRFAEQSVRVTIHELGHRYWMKFMAGDAKRAWSRHHTDMSYASPDPVFPQVGDVLDYVQGKPTVSSITQGLINFEGGGFVLKGNLVGFLRDRARRLTFPTPYAATNEEEHFCESLSLFCLGDLKGSNLAAFKVIVLGETAEQSELSLVASWGHGPRTHR
jgi:tRNA nucleotidyltransferase/poly(A) polymerase